MGQYTRRQLLARAGGAAVAVGCFGQIARVSAARAAGGACLWGARALPRAGQTNQTALVGMEQLVGRRVAVERQYQAWNDPLPMPYQTWSASAGRIPYLSWHAYLDKPSGTKLSWRAIANGTYDAWIRQQARSLRDWGIQVYFGFHHEPEDDRACGNAADYVAAHTHIRTLFAEEGANNLIWVWTLMASTYRGGNGGPAAWEPPDYDVVGVDGYNRYPCKPVAPRTFVQLFSPTRTFAISRGKPFAIGEFGCVEQNACGASGDPNGKAAWISAAAAALKTWPEAIFACYSHVTTVEGYDYWMDTSSSSLASFRAMALDPYFAGTSVIAP